MRGTAGMRIAIIGGGAAGLMAADEVTVNRVAELKEEIQREKQASEEWFRLLMDAYGDPSEE